MFEDPTVEEIARMGGLEATGMDGLRDPVAALACGCPCHTRRFSMPTGDLHEEGRTCPCQTPGVWDSTEEWLDEFHDREEHRIIAAAIEAERVAAVERARCHDLQVTVECKCPPATAPGGDRDHRVWVRARHSGGWEDVCHG